MADPFVAEIRVFPFNFAPKGWAFCDGQLLPISQNTALFSLVGTYYGGDGKSTFALPNLQDCHAIGTGQGSGLSERFLGENVGSETVTLLQTEIPAHSHNQGGGATDAAYASPGQSVVMGATRGTQVYAATGATVDAYAGGLATSGSGLPHNNRQPALGLNFCIALQGVFPPRG
jgi:microcystin-dependent protein